MEIGTVPRMATESDFTVRIRGAVKAELARRDYSGSDLVGVLGINRNAVYARLRGEQQFAVEDLSRIIAFLGITMDQLIASAALAEGKAA